MHLSSFFGAISIIDFDIQRTQTIEFENQKKLIQDACSFDLLRVPFFHQKIEKIRFDAQRARVFREIIVLCILLLLDYL